MAKKASIPSAIYSKYFFKFLEEVYFYFKATNGFGRWLREYERAEASGLFELEPMCDEFIRIQENTSMLDFQTRMAIYEMCMEAVRKTERYLRSLPCTYEIHLITGETAEDDDGDPFVNLSKEEAFGICEAMNLEAEEYLFRVYNLTRGRYET